MYIDWNIAKEILKPEYFYYLRDLYDRLGGNDEEHDFDNEVDEEIIAMLEAKREKYKHAKVL